jgi:hypothetical protein
MELLERPPERLMTNTVHLIPTHRLNQTYESHKPVIILNKFPQHYEDSGRGVSYKPSVFDKTVSSTIYPHKNTENVASTQKSSSRQ